MSPANLPLPAQVKIATAAPPVPAETPVDAPITQAVDLILQQAHDTRATDIHIEPHETLVQVRFRIDGTLRDVMTVPHQIAPAVTGRIKLMAQLKADECVVPQNGRLKYTIGSETIEARISVLPVVGGEKVVIRILDDASKIRPLDNLGIATPALHEIEHQLKRGQGMTIVTGPTGSGKSTTLYSMLGAINAKDANISTIEDPVEYAVPGINQVQVDTRSGMSFANSLRAVLRQDPNVIMVGELRDNETANLAMQATMSGHPVFAGLYTKNAASAFPHLINMNVEPFVVATSVKTVVAQRLVRRLCPDCREAYTVSTDELARIGESFPIHRAIEVFHSLEDTGDYPDSLPALSEENSRTNKNANGENRKTIPVPDDLVTDRGGILDRIAADPSLIERAGINDDDEASKHAKFKSSGRNYSPSDLKLYRAKGCTQCSMTGYFGRVGVFEVLDVTPHIIKLVTERATAEDIQKKAANDGMLTLQEDGFIKALQGMTAVEEIIPLAAA